MLELLKRILSGFFLLALWIFSVAAAAIWCLPAYLDYNLSSNRLESLREQLEQERVIVSRLEEEQEALAGDERALERAAREEYLLIRPGEEVYIFDTSNWVGSQNWAGAQAPIKGK